MYALNLDTTNQQELYERACARMAQLIPGWSDAIPSDPAVVLLELTSYLSSVQNHEINTLRERHYLAYLKFIGESPRQLVPARLMAVPAQDRMPWPGLRFEIDGVPFEAVDVPGGACQVREVSLIQGVRRMPLRADAPLVITGSAPFELEVTFDAPLMSNTPARLWLELQPEPGRSPPDAETPPPVELLAEVWGGGAWRNIPCRDGTCGLLQSGYVTLTPLVASNRLRLLIKGELEGEPRISAAAMHPVTLEQRRTRSQCIQLKAPCRLPQGWAENRLLHFFLPEGGGWREDSTLFVRDGHVCGLSGEAPRTVRIVAAEPDFPAFYPLRELPAEEIRLDENGILPDSLRLMVEENGIWYDCPVCRPEDGRTLPRGCRWDSSRKILRFGDGRDFCVPHAGRLLVAGCACTLGAGGNGAGGVLEKKGISMLPFSPASGGQDAEDGKTAFFRAAREQEVPARAVSLSDYEALAMRTPGLALARVKAVPAAQLGKAGAGVVVIAKPRAKAPLPPLTRWQRERLTGWLERFRLVGVPLEVRGPRYCPVEVRVHVRFSGPAAERSLKSAAAQHTDGVTGPLDFGGEISYTALFSALGAVPGVRTVRGLELRALSGGGWRTQEGGIKLNADTLPYLERFQLIEE
ncbi:MAG: hypothetical protein K2N78_03095 [Oscillospiraceae bacterium]|nr:hypothetical protein [Oscillospiraceae bacterium]